MTIQSDFAIIRRFVLTLPPVGESGFEGLIGACLSYFTKSVFRCARSGFQFGHDGRADPGIDADCVYECKRYDQTKLDLRDISGEIGQAARQLGPGLLWILATPISVDANAANEIRSAAEAANILSLIIDALPQQMPRLAVLLAFGRSAIWAWWEAQDEALRTSILKTSPSPKEVDAALMSIINRPGFSQGVEQLSDLLSVSTASFSAIQTRLIDYHKRRFADIGMARHDFGQPIAPRAPSVRHVARPRLIELLNDWYSTDHSLLFVLGEEGVGKSWLVADWWQERASDRALIFIPAREAVNFVESTSGDEVIAAAMLRACNTDLPETIEGLRKRLSLWNRQPPKIGPIIVLDGLNERDVNWRPLLNILHPAILRLNGVLIITCRPGYYKRSGFDALDFPKVHVEIDGYDVIEFAEALRLNGRTLADVPERLWQGLRNPRVFALAVTMLQDLGEEELTVDRLLFQYWAHRSQSRDIALQVSEFHNLLVSHAKAIKKPGHAKFDVDRWMDHSSLSKRNSERTLVHDLDEVIEGRFMEPSTHMTGKAVYTFRPETLPFALGLRLVFDIYEAVEQDENQGIIDLFQSSIEPIAGFDRSFEVLQGALAITCLHRPWAVEDESIQVAHELTIVIIEFMLGMQNRIESLRSEFIAFVRDDPVAYLDVAEGQTATGQTKVDHWLIEALRMGRTIDRDCSSNIDITTRNRRAAEIINQRLMEWIAWSPAGATIEGATDVEQLLINTFTNSRFAIRSQPHSLACQIIAGSALTPFVPSILAHMLLSASISPGITNSNLFWLMLLNHIDSPCVEAEVMRLSKDWLNRDPSQFGNQAITLLLRNVGTEVATKLAYEISGKEALDPRDDSDPDIPPEPDPSPESIVEELPNLVIKAIADVDLPQLDSIAILYPSFVAALSTDIVQRLTALIGKIQPPNSDATRLALGCATDFASTRIAFALDGLAASKPRGYSEAGRLEPFSLFQSILAIVPETVKAEILKIVPLPSEAEGWPIGEEDCAIPHPDVVENLLTDPVFATDVKRTAGLLRLLHRGAPFTPGPHLREVIAKIAGSSFHDDKDEDIYDAALQLAAHLPDDPFFDIQATPLRQQPSKSYSEVPLIARSSRRIGLAGVKERLGQSGRLMVIAHVPDCDLSTLIDLINSDLLRMAAGQKQGESINPKNAREERQIQGLLMTAADRIASESPDRLIAWGNLLTQIFRDEGSQLSLEPFALSLLPALSRISPNQAALFLNTLIDKRIQRSLSRDRSRPLTPSGISYAFAMDEHPEIDAILLRLIGTSPDDAMLAQIVAAAATAGRIGRIERFVADWITEDQPLPIVTALTVSGFLTTLPPNVVEIFNTSHQGVVKSVVDKISPRLESRLRAEEALAGLSLATDSFSRLKIEAIAIVNAMPGAPMRGDPGRSAAAPCDRLLSLRISEAAERRREKEFGKTLFGLSAPPAWLTTLATVI